jgi:hypothetical protein
MTELHASHHPERGESLFVRAATGRSAWLVGLVVLCLFLGALAGCGKQTKRTDLQKPTAASDAATRTVAEPVRHLTAAEEARERSRTVGEFAKRGSGAGELAEPFGIAVEHRSGDVYVVDTDNYRIEKFTSAGRFLRAWGWGVADGKTKALQTCVKRCFAGLRGAGAGQVEFPEGIAVDNNRASSSYGDVYIVDIWNHRVQKYSPNGKFLLMFGGNVNKSAHRKGDHANENICPVKSRDVCGKGTEGSTGGQLELAVEGSFIAVAPNNTVYVGQRNSVKAFSSAGRYQSEIKLLPPPKTTDSPEAGGVKVLAIDISGHLYVVRHSVVGVNEYTPSGQLLRTLEPGGKPAYAEGPTPSVAIDPTGNVFIDVYENYQHRIDEYSPSGVKIASFDWGQRALPGIADKEDGLPGMAYNPRSKKLYMVNADVNVKPLIARVRIISPPER